MLIANVVLWDEPISGTDTYRIDARYWSIVGSAGPEGVRLQLVCSNIAGTTPVITIEKEESNDGVHWASHSKPWNAQTLTAGSANVFFATDDATPRAAFNRYAIYLGGTGPSAHVKLVAAVRGEQGGR